MDKALLLLSGGFDSPVAGYMMKNKGLSIDAVHFTSGEFSNEKELQKEQARKALKDAIGRTKRALVNVFNNVEYQKNEDFPYKIKSSNGNFEYKQIPYFVQENLIDFLLQAFFNIWNFLK